MGKFPFFVYFLLLGIFVVHSKTFELESLYDNSYLDYLDDEPKLKELTTTSEPVIIDIAPKPLSSSSSSSTTLERPLIEKYIDRKTGIANNLIRDLKRSNFEVAFNVYSRVNSQIDNVLRHIVELLGENCHSLWGSTKAQSRLPPCNTSQEEVQQQMTKLRDTILINKNYRDQSVVIVNKFQSEVHKLNQNYATAIRSASDVSSKIVFPQTHPPKESLQNNDHQKSKKKINNSTFVVDDDDKVAASSPILSDAPHQIVLDGSTKMVTKNDDHQFEEGDEKEADIFDVFDLLGNDEEKIGLFTQYIDDLKSEGSTNSSKLVQLAFKIKNSRSRLVIVPELKAKFPTVVQNIVWQSESKIKIQVGNDTFKIVSSDNQTVIGLNDESENFIDNPPPSVNFEGHRWKFLPQDDGNCFALFNLDFKVLLGYELTKNENPNDSNGKKEGRVFLESNEERDLNMYPSHLLWKIVLLCQRTIMTVQDYSENFITGQSLNNATSGHGHDHAGLGDKNKTLDDYETLQQCPDDSLLVSLVTLDFLDLSLDVDVNGKLFLGEANNPGKFDVYN